MLWATAAAMEIDIIEIAGYSVYKNTLDTAIETTPPVKLYSTIEILPANTAPRKVRITTTANASKGEYIIKATSENIFASPILAPGRIVGNKFSIKNIIKLSPVSIARTAIFFAAFLPTFIVYIIHYII